MDEVAEFEDVGEQFRFLLQPVRDLSKNWDIDIKHYLEDYLIKLAHESKESDELDAHGKRKLFNFAEAAVVIDGSTNIYSRKVDYLLQQAQGCLTLISVGKDVKTKKRKGENGEEENVEDAENNNCVDSDSEDPEEQRRRKNPYLNPLTPAQEKQMQEQLQKLSKKRPCFPVVPLSFTPLVDYEKTNVVIFNRDEMVGKKDDFKVNTCQIVDGVALIDLKNLELLEMFTQINVEYFLTPSAKSIATLRDSLESVADTEAKTRISAVDTIHSNAEHFSQNFCDNMENINPADQQSFNGDYFDNFSDEDLASELKDLHSPNVNQDNLSCTVLATALEDSFEPLDPFEYQAEKAKPFKLNTKCTVMAEKQVKLRNQRIERECRIKGVSNIPMVKTYIDSRMFRRKIRKRSHAFAQFNSFLIDQALLALNFQFYEEDKRRNEIRKKREADAKMATRLARRTSQRTSLLHGESVARGPSTFVNSPPHYDYEDPIEELGADDIFDDNELDYLGDKCNERPLGDILSVDDLGEQNFTLNNDGFNVGRRKSALLRNDNFYDDTIYMSVPVDYPDDLPPRPLSQLEYNELVEYHLKKYWTIKEEATSKFCERVRNWEEKVTPLLEEELTHRQFNTREYSTDIIDHFGKGLGSELDFLKFVKNTVNYDLSRYLLVSLILTNMQNVKIVESDINKLKLQLLKLERHDELFDDEQKLITGG